MSGNNDDLLPEQTEGFKVGEKKTLDEYHQMGTSYSLQVPPLLLSHLKLSILPTESTFLSTSMLPHLKHLRRNCGSKGQLLVALFLSGLHCSSRLLMISLFFCWISINAFVSIT
jgi:hypothetical protein